MVTIYLYVNSNGEVDGWGSTYSEGTTAVEVEENHNVMVNPFFYTYKDGVLEYSEERRQALINEQSNKPLSEVEVLRAEVELLREQQKQSELVVLQVTDMMFDMMS